MSEHRVLDYLSGKMSAADRRAFEVDLAHDAQLRDELAQWLQIAQARQLEYNKEGRDRRDAAFHALIDTLAREHEPAAESAALSLWWRVKQWIWPGGPVTPLLPLGWALAIVMSGALLLAPAPSEIGDLAQVRGAGNGVCARLTVDLPDGVAAKQLRDVLTQYGAAIVSGPDENGRFVLSAPRMSSLTSAAKALGALSAIPEASGECPPPMKP